MKEKWIQHNIEILKKLRIPLICLICFNALEFTFFLGGYAYGGVKLDSLWSPLSGILWASAMLLSNDARLHPDNAKPKNIAAIVLFVCTFVFFILQFRSSPLF